jgi:hypothetical protein
MRRVFGRQKVLCRLPSLKVAGFAFGIAATSISPALSLEIKPPAATSEPPQLSVPSLDPQGPCKTGNCQSQDATPPASPGAADNATPSDKPGPEAFVPDTDKKGPVEVLYDIRKAPAAVGQMREKIVEAAASGDLARLRDLMTPGPNQTVVTIGEKPEDPVAELKNLSGDEDGAEILAILLDILSTGYVHVGQGTKDEMYVWPYFAQKPLNALTAPEKVDLLRLVTAGDVADMKEFGGYNFYRVGISPDGQWRFFVAGN